jgi:hypothetical protein
MNFFLLNGLHVLVSLKPCDFFFFVVVVENQTFVNLVTLETWFSLFLGLAVSVIVYLFLFL